MIFSYYCETEAEQFSFYRIPKPLVTDECFRNISTDAKLLYGLMLDRMSLSIKNGWTDDLERVYIYFPKEAWVRPPRLPVWALVFLGKVKKSY